MGNNGKSKESAARDCLRQNSAKEIRESSIARRSKQEHDHCREAEALSASGKERRDFLYSGLALAGICGLTALSVPFVRQLRPANSEDAALQQIEVDISAVKAGEQIVVKWRGQPVVIRNRLPAEIAAAKAVAVQSLQDRQARNANMAVDSLAEDSARSGGAGRENWLVFINLCTHLSCPTQNAEYGWFCPCHGSRYDMAARVIKGPANRNMAIPPYRFLSDALLQIG